MVHFAFVQRARSGQGVTQLLCSLHQKGAIGRLPAFGIDRRAKKTLNTRKASLRKYIFDGYAQAAFHCSGSGMECTGAVCVQFC